MGLRIADTNHAKVRYLEEQVGRMLRNLQVLEDVEAAGVAQWRTGDVEFQYLKVRHSNQWPTTRR